MLFYSEPAGKLRLRFVKNFPSSYPLNPGSVTPFLPLWLEECLLWDHLACEAKGCNWPGATAATVEGCEILHQLKTVVNIPLFIGFQPSKVMQDFATIHSMTLWESNRKSGPLVLIFPIDIDVQRAGAWRLGQDFIPQRFLEVIYLEISIHRNEAEVKTSVGRQESHVPWW